LFMIFGILMKDQLRREIMSLLSHIGTLLSSTVI